MTAGRVVSARKPNRKTVNLSSADDIVPGWYAPAQVTPEQQDAARDLLARRGELALAPMLGIAVPA